MTICATRSAGQSAAQRADLVTDAFHLGVISTGEPEGDLRNGAAADLAARDKPVSVKRWSERQRARARDDRLVQVKESGPSSAAALDGCTHGPAA